MEASFIIPLYNALEHTREAWRTLETTLPPGLAHEAILVDDGSTDGTRDWLRTLAPPAKALLNEKNLGFAGACNRGAAEARGRLLFFLNNDLVLLPGWYEPMRDLLDRSERVGLVGNIQRDARTGALDHTGVFFNHKGKPEHLRDRPWAARLRGYREADAVTGACCGLRADTWRELGGFDDGFRNGGEDVDLCLRARAAGRRNLVSFRSEVLHHVSASPGRKLRDEQNSRRLAERWRPAIARLSARAWAGHYLATEWHGSRDPADFPAALGALGLDLRLLPAPARAVVSGTDQAIETEFARWRQILDGQPTPPEPDRGRTDEI